MQNRVLLDPRSPFSGYDSMDARTNIPVLFQAFFSHFKQFSSDPKPPPRGETRAFRCKRFLYRVFRKNNIIYVEHRVRTRFQHQNHQRRKTAPFASLPPPNGNQQQQQVSLGSPPRWNHASRSMESHGERGGTTLLIFNSFTGVSSSLASPFYVSVRKCGWEKKCLFDKKQRQRPRVWFC